MVFVVGHPPHSHTHTHLLFTLHAYSKVDTSCSGLSCTIFIRKFLLQLLAEKPAFLPRPLGRRPHPSIRIDPLQPSLPKSISLVGLAVFCPTCIYPEFINLGTRTLGTPSYPRVAKISRGITSLTSTSPSPLLHVLLLVRVLLL